MISFKNKNGSHPQKKYNMKKERKNRKSEYLQPMPITYCISGNINNTSTN